ncbi:Spo0B C-terminal domain-containing protein [Mesobacillus stamsii]|uniref:Stage 0 sporulation protein B (Sporulation initiation phosphotransferase) n=1 Tax=Mesobacillus stamsii TaxID=225347 RepID=A0ABU0FXJ5_9BACI|nr:Spo0B C-terminal domain-containing protein [Mesobacillus stamsii]MDQ0414555.1 stage 0 sporulation protein B (sporulation initiation phosphotransferase) [Mesobacillus stamsii]
MKKEWNTIEVLRHERHDWMNKLQLIKGNLSLNKVDRAKEIIEEIIMEARQDAKLSNLHLPQFASTLLTCNWECHHFLLEYEVMNSHTFHCIDDQLLTDWTEQLFETLNSSIEPYQENHLSVTIEPQEKGIGFFFDFSGIIKDKNRLVSFLDQQPGKNLEIISAGMLEGELTIEVFMKTL